MRKNLAKGLKKMFLMLRIKKANFYWIVQGGC